jgi:hypothetical protein
MQRMHSFFDENGDWRKRLLFLFCGIASGIMVPFPSMGFTAPDSKEESVVKRVEIPPTESLQTETTRLRTGLSIGMEYYMGVSNFGGSRARVNDGMWAGWGTFYPSNVSVNWRNAENRAFRLSLGLGDMTTSSGGAFRQPIEAYYQMPLRGGQSLTVGKFFVPFATQEWEYESKPGIVWQGARGDYSYAASLNYNTNQNTPNIYLRLGRQFGENTMLGLSAGFGRGLFYNTSHRTAFALDFAHNFGSAQFNFEYNLANGPNGMFHFGVGRLTLTNLGRWEPFLGFFTWRDRAEEIGNFRSSVLGLRYHVSSYLTLEGAYSRVGSGNVYWLQSYIHF